MILIWMPSLCMATICLHRSGTANGITFFGSGFFGQFPFNVQYVYPAILNCPVHPSQNLKFGSKVEFAWAWCCFTSLIS